MVADEPNAKRNKCWLLCSRMDPRVSQKPQKATEDEKNKRKRKKKSKQTITRAVTPIPLIEANPGKLDVLDQLVEAYLALTGRYVTLFCTVVEPNKYAEPIFETSLSQRLCRGQGESGGCGQHA